MTDPAAIPPLLAETFALLRAHYPLRCLAWADASHRVRIGHGHIVRATWAHALFNLPAREVGRRVDLLARPGGRLPPGEQLVIEPGQAESLLRSDLNQTARFMASVTLYALHQAGITLTAGQFNALCAMVYLTGQGRYAQSQLKHALAAGDLDRAGELLAAWPDIQALWRGPEPTHG